MEPLRVYFLFKNAGCVCFLYIRQGADCVQKDKNFIYCYTGKAVLTVNVEKRRLTK